MQEPAVRQKEAVRILFVDDEPNILLTMPAILQQHGYDVTAVGTVNEALTQITSAQFAVLISDLNIGHPGDGFTVVSAMRRTQPTCITLILTGYPGFDSALEAIRSQVDDYLIKPAPIPSLIKLIEQKLQNPKPGTGEATKPKLWAHFSQLDSKAVVPVQFVCPWVEFPRAQPGPLHSQLHTLFGVQQLGKSFDPLLFTLPICLMKEAYGLGGTRYERGKSNGGCHRSYRYQHIHRGR
jgi:ActR/RegA family two-component response regulator